MGIALSLFLFTVGAILTFAINVTYSHGVNWSIVGEILMGVGAFGLILAIILWGLGPWGGVRRRSTIIDGTGRVVRREDVDSYVP